MDEIETELSSLISNEDEELPKVEEIKSKKKRGSTRERMIELNEIKKTRAEEKRILREKADEIMRIKQEKIEIEYQEAQKLKEAIEKKKAKMLEEKPIELVREEKEKKKLYKEASRDILKEKYLEEAKKRVMMDLFS